MSPIEYPEQKNQPRVWETNVKAEPTETGCRVSVEVRCPRFFSISGDGLPYWFNYEDKKTFGAPSGYDRFATGLNVISRFNQITGFMDCEFSATVSSDLGATKVLKEVEDITVRIKEFCDKHQARIDEYTKQRTETFERAKELADLINNLAKHNKE